LRSKVPRNIYKFLRRNRLFPASAFLEQLAAEIHVGAASSRRGTLAGCAPLRFVAAAASLGESAVHAFGSRCE
jgi:hypothetical protein